VNNKKINAKTISNKVYIKYRNINDASSSVVPLVKQS